MSRQPTIPATGRLWYDLDGANAAKRFNEVREHNRLKMVAKDMQHLLVHDALEHEVVNGDHFDADR